MALVTDISLRELFRHLGLWLSNLRRAGDERKRQSIKALRAVIIAARNTKTYLRKMHDTAQQDHSQEAKLAQKWTGLGFVLKDLGLGALAKRCDITGRYWADPEQFDREFLDRADVGLARMEQLARQLVAEIERK
ncbi:MAG: hypothetical protein GY802_01605 [Gammaproteobacteria bacterium]|nr:hypothetical protein [Gammaproteobacteria bacterium]